MHFKSNNFQLISFLKLVLLLENWLDKAGVSVWLDENVLFGWTVSVLIETGSIVVAAAPVPAAVAEIDGMLLCLQLAFIRFLAKSEDIWEIDKDDPAEKDNVHQDDHC